MRAINIRIQHMKNPVGLDVKSPLISWTACGGIKQTAYQILAYSENETVWDSGKVESASMQTYYGGSAKSRKRIYFTVTLWDENDHEEKSEEICFFEFALLLQSDFQAKWVNPEIDTFDVTSRQNASYLRKSFAISKDDAEKDARIYATAHGIYVLYLNGKRVEGTVLAPGTTEYSARLAYQTYDISGCLKEGENHIEAILGDGWYRGCNGNTGTRNVFGTDVAFWMQMETGDEIKCVTDASWEATQDGAIGKNDIQLGERIDARKIPSAWHAVKLEPFGTENFFCTNAPVLSEQETFSAKLIQTPNGKQVLDFGQNMAGYIRFSLEAKEGQRIKLTFGEYLGSDGNFTDENFHTIGRKGSELHQVIEYICKEGRNEYKTQFSIFGFQMAEIETDIPVDGSEFTAIAVYSDIEQTGFFECDNPLVNRLFQNAVWSEKSNFTDIPIDCPQRERSGWTGDAGLFAETGIQLMDAASVYRKWLGECRVLQYEDGKIANIAPRRQPVPSKLDEKYDGASAWGDAVVIIPYLIYRMYGEKEVLEENYEMMRKWVLYCEKKATKTRLRNRIRRNPYQNYMIDTGVQWGEWLEAGISVKDAMKEILLKGVPEMTTPYFAKSAWMLSEIAEILGKTEDSKYFKTLYQNANRAYHYLELKDGHIHSDRQCRFVRPLYMGLLTEKEAGAAAGDLNTLVEKNDYHLNTGFLTTPYLCQVLADFGYTETAYRVLLQEDTPGWLYAVKHGATTVWESWEGYLGDVGFASLNHYSKGAVTGWMLRGILGIQYSYDRIIIKPQPCPLMRYAKGAFESPRGRIESGWEYGDDGNIKYRIAIPPNVRAVFIAPDGSKLELHTGENVL